MDTQVEVERKFAVSAEFELAKVGFPDSVVVAADRELTLDSTYFDTPDLRLAQYGITLRRRIGGDDEGWHLKIPYGDDARQEVRESLDRAKTKPPKSLRDLVVVHARGGIAMRPVVRITTTRMVHHLRERSTRDRRILAEVVDDRVSAEVDSEDFSAASWREIEVELVDGTPAILDEATEALVAAGATRSPVASKLARALGDRIPDDDHGSDTVSKHDPAGNVVLTYLRQQIAALKTADPGVRVDAPDAVHQMRVACRRLRSALKTFRPVFDRQITDPIRDELTWIASALGDARDTEVMHARLRGEAEQDHGNPARDAALARIDHDLDARYAEAHSAALRAMNTERYVQLLNDLDRLLDDPPLTPMATEAAKHVLPPLVGKAFRVMRRLYVAAEAAGTLEEHEAGLHEVRKAAKRARYAGEALKQAFGQDAKRFAAAMEEIQEVLGDYHDSVVTQQTLVDMASRAHEAGENTFELGRIAGREQQRLIDAEHEFHQAWKAASKKKLRRWTR